MRITHFYSSPATVIFPLACMAAAFIASAAQAAGPVRPPKSAVEFGITSAKLSNGQDVLAKPCPGGLVSVHLWVRVGGAEENDANSGACHFLEHMLFKGTKSRTPGQIAVAVESNGGRINAATGDDYTFYHITIPTESARVALEILSDVACNATFPPDEFERERRVILEEIKRRGDSPEAVRGDRFTETLYRTSPYHRRVIGSSATIAAMSREDLGAFYRSYYVPSNMTLVVAGDLKPSWVLARAQELFGGMPAASSPKLPDLSEKNPGSDAVREMRPVNQTYVAAGFIGPSASNPDHYAMDVAAQIIGRGMASRLWREIRENRRLVSSIGASFYTQAGPGAFVVEAQGDPALAEQALPLVRDIMEKFSKDGPTEAEMERARRMIRSDWVRVHETVSGQAHDLGWASAVAGWRYSPTYLDRIEKLSAGQVRAAFAKYLPPGAMASVTLVPKK